MASVNRVMLLGYLGRDPEVRSLANGSQVANLSVATGESWTDKRTGERIERTEWHKIVIFNENLVKMAEQYLRKGSRIYVEGQLQTRKWQDQSGADRYATEVVLRQFNSRLVLLDKSETRQGGGEPAVRRDEYREPVSREAAATTPKTDYPDDDIPF